MNGQMKKKFEATATKFQVFKTKGNLIQLEKQ